jgi:formylmethanofuran dehydrogenase subunit A
MDDLVHIAFDFFNVLRYVLSNIASFFSILFNPLAWLFNLLKGFFDGVSSPPPATAIAWTFPDNIMAVFNAIPYFNLIEYACGAGISILVLVFIFRRFAEF